MGIMYICTLLYNPLYRRKKNCRFMTLHLLRLPDDLHTNMHNVTFASWARRDEKLQRMAN